MVGLGARLGFTDILVSVEGPAIKLSFSGLVYLEKYEIAPNTNNGIANFIYVERFMV